MLATDKAFSKHYELYENYQPEITFHDSAFSMMMNFHALGEYFNYSKGYYHHQLTQRGIITSLFGLGFSSSDFPLTQHAVITYLDCYGPGDLFNLYRHIETTISTCDLDILISYLNATQWDPHIFDTYMEFIVEKLHDIEDESLLKDLLTILPKVANNFYYLPNCPSTLFNIGLLLQSLGEYQLAINYYQQSMQYTGKTNEVLYNMGLCYCSLKKYKKAAPIMQQAVEINKENMMARGWLSYISDIEKSG